MARRKRNPRAKINLRKLSDAYKEVHDVEASLYQFMEAEDELGQGFYPGPSNQHYKLMESLSVTLKHLKNAIKQAARFNKTNRR